MTRKHFKLIADALKASKPLGEDYLIHGGQWELTVDNLTRELSRTNPLFKPERFKAACGLPDEVGPAISSKRFGSTPYVHES